MLKKILSLIILITVFAYVFFAYNKSPIVNSVDAADAAPVITKRAIDATGAPATAVPQGGTATWVVDIKNNTEKILDLKVNDNGISANQTFVFSPYKDGSNNPIAVPMPNPEVPYTLGLSGVMHTPAWEQIAGLNVSTGDITYPNGNWAYENTAVSSPSTGTNGTLPGHNLGLILDTFGDGYTPIFVTMPDGEKRIYAIWHHQYVWEPWGPFPDGSGGSVPSEFGVSFVGEKFPNILCVSITNNAVCSDYGTLSATNPGGTVLPKVFSSAQSATAGKTADEIAGFATGWSTKDIATTLYPKYYTDTVNGRIYYLAGRAINSPQTSPITDPGSNRASLFANPLRQAEIGIGCWDYINDTNCDGGAGNPSLKSFYKFADLDFSMWFNTAITGEVMADGLYFNNNKFYFYYQDATDGNFATADAIKFACYDMVTQAACAGYPYTYPGVTSFKETFKAPFEVHNGKMYVALNRSQYLSTTGTNEQLIVMCFDTTTNVKCAGWTDFTVAPGVISRNNGTDFGNTPSIFNLENYGMCLGYDNLNSSLNGATQSSYCFDYTTGAQIGAMNNYVNVLQDNTATHGDYNVTLYELDGTTSRRIYITQDKIQNGDAGDVNRIYCYIDNGITYVKCPDFGNWNGASYDGYRDFNSCTETNQAGVALGCEPNLNIQYGYVLDPETQCMYGLAHSGNLWSFDPFTGATPCFKSSNPKYLLNPTDTMYCDKLATRQSDWKWLVRIYNAPAGTYSAKFFDPSSPTPQIATPYPGGLITVSTPGGAPVLDLIPPALGMYPSMAVFVSSIENAFRSVSTPLNYSLIYYNSTVGDAPDPQFCFTTTVDDVCNIETISNKTDLEWGISNYPSTTRPAVFSTVVSNTATLNVTNKVTCNPSQLGDYVWLDSDHDGIQDPTEVGINGVVVNLRNSADDSIVATTTTATNLGLPGYYLFDPVYAGTYYVEFVLPTGYVFTTMDQGVDSSDSDADPLTGQTADIVLVGNENIMTIDAGLYLPKIGDYFWNDKNGNGIQETGEVGINGVVVNLYDAAAPTVILATTTTANSITSQPGWYQFADLMPGNYIVEFIEPATYMYGAMDNPATTDLLDSDANTTTGRTTTIVLAPGVDQFTWDAGVYIPACIGDTIWLDSNHNGIQDNGEVGLAGVTVTLTLPDGTTRTTVTDADGNYSFCGLPEGNYTVSVTLPNGYVVTLPNQGTDDAVDNDLDATGTSGTISLTQGVDNMTVDGGLYLPKIGDYFWNDKNGNGIQETGEVGINGVVVNLYDAAAPTVILATTTTANSITSQPGWYQFADLMPGNYIVEFIEPATYMYGAMDNPATTDLLDSDANTTTGRTTTIVLAPGVDQFTWDAGVYIPACIGDTIWLDSNHNGIQDNGEVGLAGVTVTLTLPDGTTRTTVTDADGNYSFCGLPEGNYTVSVTLPNGYVVTLPNQGTDDAVDNDLDATGTSGTISLTQGVDNMTVDGGLYLPMIGDYVWNDIDGDGVQETGETPIPGVVVNIYSTSNPNVILDTTVTDVNGEYMFYDVMPGDYIIEFVEPTNYVFTSPNVGNNTLDSDANVTTGMTTTITVLPGVDDLTWDAGLFIPACLGDTVWYDKDQDGIQDADEPGLAGVTVTLHLPDGTTRTTVTDADGNYSFCGLPQGDYTIEFTRPEGYVVTLQDAGGNDSADSDIDPSTLTTPVIHLMQGVDQDVWDAGFTLLKIGDTVWVDENQNGVQDTGEPGVSGVTVHLFEWSSTTVLETTVTDSNGNYIFDELPTGDYYIQILPPTGYGVTTQNAGSDDTKDSDISVATYLTGKITLTNANDITWDGGLTLGCIGDYVWDDIDGDGVQDTNEVGIPNVVVTLVMADGTIKTTTTDATGHYSFCDLKAGNYTVKIEINQPALMSYPSYQNGFNNTTVITRGVNLAPGQIYNDADFGFVGKVKIGDRVFIDNDKDCVFNNNDKGVAGIKLNLKDASGNIVASTITDANGYYYFIADANKVYTVEVDGAWNTTGPLKGSTPNCGTSKTSPNLTPGQVYLDLDFGFYCPPLPNTGRNMIYLWLLSVMALTLSSAGYIYIKKF